MKQEQKIRTMSTTTKVFSSFHGKQITVRFYVNLRRFVTTTPALIPMEAASRQIPPKRGSFTRKISLSERKLKDAFISRLLYTYSEQLGQEIAQINSLPCAKHELGKSITTTTNKKPKQDLMAEKSTIRTSVPSGHNVHFQLSFSVARNCANKLKKGVFSNSYLPRTY